MGKILFVEDEHHIRNITSYYLKKAGYEIIEAKDGEEALSLFAKIKFDLVILDIMLPKIDGLTVLKKIKAQSSVLVILLTALSNDLDEIAAFEFGADDYITKPFNPNILVARVNAISKLTYKKKFDVIKANGIELHSNSHSVKMNNKSIDLTNKEYIILKFFLENQNQVLNRDQILEKVWGYNYYGDTRVVDTHVKNLRKKLKENGKSIVTVIGVGYKFEVK